jgi:hypothetical protein
MGFWLLIIILTLLIVSGLIFIAYWIPKKYGKRKLGIGLAIFIALIFATPIMSFIFEDFLFFKSDATESLNEHGVILKDDFNLKSNKITGIGDFYHRFELRVSESDKNKLKEWIINSENYNDSIPEMFNIKSNKPRYSDIKKEYKVTYQDEQSYVYEYYRPNKQGYTPTWDKISISKKENELTYERILD